MQWIACQKRNGGLSGWFGSQLQCIATHFFITQPHSHTYILSHTGLSMCLLVGVHLCMPCDMYLYFCVNKYKKYLYQCCTERVSGEGWGLVGSTKPGLIRHARIEFPPAPAANTNTIINTNTKTRKANTWENKNTHKYKKMQKYEPKIQPPMQKKQGKIRRKKDTNKNAQTKSIQQLQTNNE